MSEFSVPSSADYPLEQLVSEKNIERWTSIYEEQAHAWLSNLPEQVATYAEKWQLDIEGFLYGGTASVVIGAKQNDQPAVLKIHPPWMPRSAWTHTSAETEAGAFKIWDGNGAPRLLASDAQALLLERIISAHHSPDLEREEMLEFITQVACPMSMPLAHALGIPLVDFEIKKRFDRALPSRIPEISLSMYQTAWETACFYASFGGLAVLGSIDWVLVHGDLKVKNILERQDGSLAVIDPSPAIGSRLLDATLWTIDNPRDIVGRCKDVAEYFKADHDAIGRLAVSLAIPEICLASPGRAAETLEYIKEVAGTSDLDSYFENKFLSDPFMDRYVEIEPEYVVIRNPKRP